MLRDPCLRWPGCFPYDALAPAGITPGSTQREVLDASFELMAQGRMTAEARQAWDELRRVPRRLAVDFLLYPVDLRREIERARQVLDGEIEGSREARESE
jgi:hypothetical protein